MKKWIVVLAAAMGGMTLAAAWASHAGFGVARPDTAPLSLREHSVRAGGVRGHGLVGGK